MLSEPHVLLSDPFEVSNIDTQERPMKLLRGEKSSNKMEQDDIMYITAVKDGMWNAVVFWFECELYDGIVLKSYDMNGDLGAAASSWNAAVQYLDEIPVKSGESIEELRVQRDVDRLYFSSAPPSTRPRHANIPSWHYDMLNDTSANEAHMGAQSNEPSQSVKV